MVEKKVDVLGGTREGSADSWNVGVSDGTWVGCVHEFKISI